MSHSAILKAIIVGPMIKPDIQKNAIHHSVEIKTNISCIPTSFHTSLGRNRLSIFQTITPQ